MAKHLPDSLRKKFATMYDKLVKSGVGKKIAMLKVRDRIRKLHPGYCNSRNRVYAWCRQFGMTQERS